MLGTSPSRVCRQGGNISFSRRGVRRAQPRHLSTLLCSALSSRQGPANRRALILPTCSTLRNDLRLRLPTIEHGVDPSLLSACVTAAPATPGFPFSALHTTNHQHDGSSSARNRLSRSGGTRDTAERAGRAGKCPTSPESPAPAVAPGAEEDTSRAGAARGGSRACEGRMPAGVHHPVGARLG